MHNNAYISRRSENNIKCVMYDDLGWKNQTIRYSLPHHWLYEWFSQFHSCGTYSVLSQSPSINNPLLPYSCLSWYRMTNLNKTFGNFKTTLVANDISHNCKTHRVEGLLTHNTAPRSGKLSTVTSNDLYPVPWSVTARPYWPPNWLKLFNTNVI